MELRDIVSMSQRQSPFYYQARNSFERSYWKYQNFRAGFKPQVRLNATIPTFYREINPITQPDGSIKYVRVSQANNSVGVNILKNIGFTGGTLSVGTSLQRTDNFSGNLSSFFLTNPFKLSYQQNSLLFNDFNWSKKIEPVLFDISEKGYSEDLEVAALEAVKLFFDALERQFELENIKLKMATSDTLFKVLQARFNIGTVPQNDLLQLELNNLKSQYRYVELLVEFKQVVKTLKRTVGISEIDSLVFISPGIHKFDTILYERALEAAQNNRKAILEFRSKRLLADMETAKAKGQNSLELSVYASLGTQQTSPTFYNAYQNLQNQQYLGLTVNLPILDWGYRKSQIRLAKANRELVEVNVEQDELNFEQEIFMQVFNYNKQNSQLQLAEKIDLIAQRKVEITIERYLLGKIGITELKLAWEESDEAKKVFIEAMRNSWISFYTLRRLTLFDFEKNERIIHTYKI